MGSRAADSDSGNISHSLIVDLGADDGILREGNASCLGSAFGLEGFGAVLIVSEEVVDTGQVEPTRDRQGDWRPVDQHGVGCDGESKEQSGQQGGREHGCLTNAAGECRYSMKFGKVRSRPFYRGLLLNEPHGRSYAEPSRFAKTNANAGEFSGSTTVGNQVSIAHFLVFGRYKICRWDRDSRLILPSLFLENLLRCRSYLVNKAYGGLSCLL